MHSFKKKIPDYIKIPGHFLRSHVAALIYQFPAKKMIIVGVTGTKGKTSTANFVWSVLHAGGYKTGLISTAIFRFGSDEEINPYHMTMPDAFIIQKNLKRMQEKGIEIVVIEMTSEGMKQYRHAGIPIDIAIFTNLSPEHLPSHKNNFELYKKAKAKLFQALSKKPKKLRGISVPRSIIANSDNDHAKYYLQFEADKKITYGIDSGDIRATEIKNETIGVSFTAINETFKISIFGAFNIYNALPALIVGTLVHIPTENIRKGLVSLAVIPGRMEEINEGQDFTLFVDYAHEPVSIGAVLSAAEEMKKEEMSGMGKKCCAAMGKSQMVATDEGGVIVLAGNKLMKYDADLNLVKEVEVKMPMSPMGGKQCPMMGKMMARDAAPAAAESKEKTA